MATDRASTGGAPRPREGSGEPDHTPATTPKGRADLAELRFFRAALLQMFPIPAEAKAAALAKVTAILKDPQAPARATVAATRVLAALASVNLQAIDLAMKARATDELVDEVALLSESVERMRMAQAAPPPQPRRRARKSKPEGDQPPPGEASQASEASGAG
jgi:hypothetical protein